MKGRVYARLYRPTYTQKIPVNAQFVQVKGRRCARWTQRGGRIVTAPVSAAGDRCSVTVDCWWIEYRDHRGDLKREECFRDRTASEKRKLDIIQRVERQRAGLPVPVASTTNKSISELLDAWRQSIIDAGNSEPHANLYRRRVDAMLAAMKAHRPADVSAELVESTLAEWRRRDVKPISYQTSNHYLTAVRAFIRWCIPKYLDADPLGALSQLNADLHRTFERRALTPKEFEKLLKVTAERDSRSGIPGPVRSMAYLVTAYTGVRLGELCRLVPASFRLSETPPVVQIPTSKGKAPVVQVVPDAVAKKLRKFLADRPATEPIWSTASWAKERKASRTLRADLAAAGIPFKDDTGRVFNFHALRTQYATWLARAGVPIQHAQKLLRHSDPRLTIKFYTKLGAADLAAELEKLPKPK